VLAAASVLVVAVISLIITRVATVALTLTGLSREVARFQSRSALSGVGFTTSEAEAIVNHPVRRRVVMTLMLLGSAGVATAIAALMLSFAGADREQASTRLAILVPSLLGVLWLARSRWFDRRLSPLIARALRRWSDLDARDYASLLHIGGDYAVIEVQVQEGDYLAGGSLRELDLRSEGVIVLGVTPPSGEYLGAPDWSTRMAPGDVAIVYGPRERICELDRRPAGGAGAAAHDQAVAGATSDAGDRSTRAPS
jgi:hypothetical protein